MRNEIGFMEDRLEEVLGKQLHLEVEGQGVYDYDTVKLFEQNGKQYILCLRISEGREGYLLRADDLGDGWWTLIDITDDEEWEQAKNAAHDQKFSGVIHR